MELFRFPPILGGGASSSGGERNAPLPQPPSLYSFQHSSDQNPFICEDEMASLLHHYPLREDEFRSHLFNSCAVSIPFTQPQGSVSLTPPLQPPPAAATAMYTQTATEGQVIAMRRADNSINFSRNIYTGGRVEEAAPCAAVVRDPIQVRSSATPAMVTGAVSQNFVIPSLSQKAIETVCEIAGPSSSEPIEIQPWTETKAADDRKRKERAVVTEETAEEARVSTAKKRSRAAELHRISERKRRGKFNEKMKALQELVPRCNKTDKVSILDDATEYLKSLQMQIQMMSTGGGGMMPMMYTPNMQHFMPHTAMGKMGMNHPPFIPFPGMAVPRPAHMAGLGPAPPCYLNPYSQFGGFQQPPPLQNRTSQLNFSQGSTKKAGDKDNKPTS